MTRTIQSVGIALTLAYGAFVVWVYAAQPKTIADLKNAAAVGANVYSVDKPQFDEAIANFRAGRYAIAAEHFARADPASRDPKTQFLIAYSHYALGKGKIYDDDVEFKLALAAVDHCLEIAPNNAYSIDDPSLVLDYSSGDRLRLRIKDGLEVTPDDLNPLKKEPGT